MPAAGNLRVDRLKTKYGTNDPHMIPPGISAREVFNIGGGPRVPRPTAAQLTGPPAPLGMPGTGIQKIRVKRPRFTSMPAF